MVFGQLRVLAASIVSIGAVALLYAEVGKVLVNMGTGNGQFTGAFSSVITDVDTVVPLVLAALLLGMVVWFIASAVQREKTIGRRPPR